MEPTAGIYEIRNTVNGHRYIGQGVSMSRRWRRHLYELRRGEHKNSHLQRAWLKYGEAVFEFRVMAPLYPPIVAGRLAHLEQEAVDIFKPEYNIQRECVVSGLGTKRTAETRAKMSAALRGKRRGPLSTEHRAKLSAKLIGNRRTLGYRHTPAARAKIAAAGTGRRHTPETIARMSIVQSSRSLETRAKISAAQLGRTATPEARAKMSAAKRGRAVSVEVRARLLEYAHRPHSPEHRARTSASLRAHNRIRRRET